MRKNTTEFIVPFKKCKDISVGLLFFNQICLTNDFSKSAKTVIRKILFFVFLFSTVGFYSQETNDESKKKAEENAVPEYIEIHGLVLDLGPLPNVVVFEKGKDNLVMTDKDGKFSIKIPLKNFKNKVLLRFEILSLKSKEIEILPNTKYIRIQLNNPEDVLSDKWTIEFVFEKPDITELILKRLEKIIFLSHRVKTR